MQLTNTQVDLNAQKITIKEVITDGIKAELEFDEENTIIWPEISNKTSPTNNDKNQEWSYDLEQLININTLLIINKNS